MFTGSPPKERKTTGTQGWEITKLGLDLWSAAGKAKYLKWGIQFGMSWYESGSAWDAATDVTIKGVKDRAIDTAAEDARQGRWYSRSSLGRKN